MLDGVTDLVAHGDPPRYFRFPRLAGLGLPHLTTTRHFAGVTAPPERTGPFRDVGRAALRELGMAGDRLAWVRQVHGAAVARAPAGGGFAGVADALVTAERGVPLAIVTADCLAITLWDADAGALGVVHAGWRGTVQAAARAAVQALAALGARPARLEVAIGPSIGPCCYEVDAPVTEALDAAHGTAAARWLRPAAGGRAMLDLWAANETLLLEAGVDPARIENPRLCTACCPDLLYSYRKGNHGRLVTVAALP
jgi:YfiH family protein